MIRIQVIHRNCIFRDCLISFLRHSRDCEVVGVDYHNIVLEEPEALEGDFDLTLLDLDLPDRMAHSIITILRQNRTDVKIILLVPESHENLLECIAAGVQGCVLECSSLSDLDQAIDEALRGETVCSKGLAATIFSEISRKTHGSTWSLSPSSASTTLTFREREVIDLLAKRRTNKQIAKALCLSLFTVKNHVHNILEKLNVESRFEAVDRARQENWLSHS